jgi:hypothetical protein
VLSRDIPEVTKVRHEGLGKGVSPNMLREGMSSEVAESIPQTSLPGLSLRDLIKDLVRKAPWVRAVVAANPFNPRLRASNWWLPLMDRFVPIEVPQPSVDEVVAFMGKVANTEMPGWVRELVEKYVDVITLRKAEQAAKYVATSLRRGRSEEAIKVGAERILQTTRRLITREHEDNDFYKRFKDVHH